MTWRDSDPPATDVLFSFSVRVGEEHAIVEIDVLHGVDRGVYRATIGDLFNSRELGRTSNLEELLRLLQETKNASSKRAFCAALDKFASLP